MNTVQGTFDVSLRFRGIYEDAQGTQLGRAQGDKPFHGLLDARSTVHMLSARTSVAGSAGEVAIERIEGSLDGKVGAFVAQHFGTMQGGNQHLRVEFTPDSGTGELLGLRGTMGIRIDQGKH
ncbi:MAG: hypothetical protein RL385_3882 [Pseudomonadota bacterium]|jgi:hypothetical protein